jgi:hypothetical protein
VADIELYSFGPNDNAHNTTNYSVLKAWLGGERDLSDLASWWAFDEATHKEMKLHMLTNHLGFTREQLFSRGDQTRELLKNEKTVEIDKEALRTATRFLAMRDGPAMLCGAMALLERENVWTTQTNWRAYRDIYKFPNEAMVPINVHTYIDLFHVRIGEYIVGKYADTKEKQEMIKTLYQSQKMKQFEMSKQYYGKVLQGQSVSIGLHDADGNMA